MLFANLLASRNSAVLCFLKFALKKDYKSQCGLDLGSPPGRHFSGARRCGVDFRFFFKNVEFSEMIKEFDAFCELAGFMQLRCLVFFEFRI